MDKTLSGTGIELKSVERHKLGCLGKHWRPRAGSKQNEINTMTMKRAMSGAFSDTATILLLLPSPPIGEIFQSHQSILIPIPGSHSGES